MKVICVDVSNQENYLVLGKEYDVEINENSTGMYCLSDNEGGLVTYLENRFKLVEDIRNEKLEELLG